MDLEIRIRAIDNGYLVVMDKTEDVSFMGMDVAAQGVEETYFSSIESAYQYVIVKLYKLKDGEPESGFNMEEAMDEIENRDHDTPTVPKLD